MIADLKPYPEYKASGLPWLGTVPAHWGRRRMKFLFKERVQKGFPEEPLLAATQSKGVVRKADYGARTVTAMKDLHLLKLVEIGDFVISLRSFEGGIEIAHCRGIISPAYTVLTPRREASQSYYARFFKSSTFINSLTLFVTGIREGQNIDYERLSRAYVPLPPAEEQVAIGRFLDWANRRFEAAIRAKRKIISLLTEQKQAIINRAVTRGLDSSIPLKPSRIPWVGDIPLHWEICSVKRLARRGGKTFTDGDWIELPFITDSGVRLIQTGNVGMGDYREKGFRFISEETFKAFGCTEVVPNDVLICRLDGPVGRACLAPELGVRMITSVDNTILKLRSAVDARFVVYLMSSSTWLNWIQSICRAGGGFRYRVSRSMLGTIQVPTPPLVEQEDIVSYIEDATAPISRAICRLQGEIELLREYRTRLVADVVTGKLDVREAASRLSDEAAPEPFEAVAGEIDDIESDDAEADV
jgi:type I restriction enzyme, S subunit